MLIVKFFFIPSLSEEIVWRAALLPRPSELQKEAALSFHLIFFVSLAFVGTHIWPTPNILDKLPGRARQDGAFEVFRHWTFLLQVAILSVFVDIAYYWDGSIWPCVIMHWGAVIVMQLGYGYNRNLAPHLEWHDSVPSKVDALQDATLLA